MPSFILLSIESILSSAVLAVLGASWAGLYWISSESLYVWLTSRRFQGLYRQSSEEGMAFFNSLLSRKEKPTVWTSSALLLLPPIALILLTGIGDWTAAAVSFFGLLGVLAGRSAMGWTRTFRKKFARRAAKHLLTFGQNKDIDLALENLFKHPHSALKTVGLELMQEWASPDNIRVLEAAGVGHSAELQEKISQVLAQMKQLGSAETLQVEPLETYFKEFAHITEEVAANMSQIKDWNVYQKKIDQIHSNIDRIIQSQTTMRTSFPDVYCRECRARAEEVIHEEWRFVRCRLCKEAPDLVAGIRKVIGEVGGEQDWNHSGDTLYVSMWDNSEKAMPAQVDLLWIKLNPTINYDWAVSAVVESLKNRFPDEIVRIKVEVEPGVKMSRNTEMLLDGITARDLPSPSASV